MMNRRRLAERPASLLLRLFLFWAYLSARLLRRGSFRHPESTEVCSNRTSTGPRLRQRLPRWCGSEPKRMPAPRLLQRAAQDKESSLAEMALRLHPEWHAKDGCMPVCRAR
jgi:hypothetical protein